MSQHAIQYFKIFIDRGPNRGVERGEHIGLSPQL